MGMLAPFVENLVTEILKGTGKLGVDSLGHDQGVLGASQGPVLGSASLSGRGRGRGDLLRGMVQLAIAGHLALAD